MAFEDDMIEAGYSDEEEYLESLIDDYEEDCARQKERELKYKNAFDYYDEEEEYERQERQHKREMQKQWVNEWKERQPDLATIWEAYFSRISYYASMVDRHFTYLNEYNKLKEWLNERTHFENERKKNGWSDSLFELFSLYKNELFEFYFPDNEEHIIMSIVSQQANELSSIESQEPILWRHISSYSVESKLLKTIEEDAFWNVVYNREMFYEFWRDNNIEKYNDFAKQWVAKNDTYVFGDWLSKHKAEEIEWKKHNHNIWEKFKQCCEVKERNKFIESKIEEYNNKGKPQNEYEDIFGQIDFIDESFDEDVVKEPVLYDFECFEIEPFDSSSVSIELRRFIDDSISALDISKIDRESSRKADKLMTQLWVYTNRDEWEMDALKKYNDYFFKYKQKDSKELLNWWKVKYPQKWDDFQTSILPSFKMDFITVMKFRLWALDGNKEEFFSLGDKYLPYWGKTLKFMYGQDIHDQLCNYFHDEPIVHIGGPWGEDVDYIKKHTSTIHEVEIWQKELQDKTIWDVIYNGNYKKHRNYIYVYFS